MINAIQIHKSDNVAMVTAQVEKGQDILITETGQVVNAMESIRAGHKVALTKLVAGETVVKYGIPIGRMSSAVDKGGWISTHNLEDTTEELCGEYCQKFREGSRKIKAYPRKDGRFGIRNYIIVIPTSPESNAVAEAISDQTGCIWFVCDRTRLEEGHITEYTKNAMIYVGRNPNVYAVLVLGTNKNVSTSSEIRDLIVETSKSVKYLSINESEGYETVRKGVSIIQGFQKEASALKRKPIPMEGLYVTLQCSASDWTTAINGNTSVGAAVDLIVKNGGRASMAEWMEWSGSQHIMAEKCATRELGIELLDTMDEVRATVLRETGHPVEYMNPLPGNKEAGLTTLVEKSTGTIKKAGNTPIQGILDYCEQPSGKGVWLTKHNTISGHMTATYGALSGAHMSILITGIGPIYNEIPPLLCIRVTGNPITYNNDVFKIDFNAGVAFDGKSISEVGEMLFEYLIRVAEGDEDPKTETNKERAFHMYYYIENEIGAETSNDKEKLSKMPYNRVYDYHEKCKQFTDSVK